MGLCTDCLLVWLRNHKEIPSSEWICLNVILKSTKIKYVTTVNLIHLNILFTINTKVNIIYYNTWQCNITAGIQTCSYMRPVETKLSTSSQKSCMTTKTIMYGHKSISTEPHCIQQEEWGLVHLDFSSSSTENSPS